MGKYTEAAHEAFRAAESQSAHAECRHPANNLVREFLLQVRRHRLQTARPDQLDNMARQMKKAADELLEHPYRVHDMASAQKVKGCGPSIAKIIVNDLFAEYPPEPPSEEELHELADQEAAIKAAAAAQRKRKKQEAVAAAAAAAAGPATGTTPPALPPQPAMGFGAGIGVSGGALLAEAAAGEEDGEEGRAGKKQRGGGKKGPKEYIPALRSASYTFLICMLQAQKGPSKVQHFGKQEVMELAEASGISNKPIFGDGTAQRRTVDGRVFEFNGWSSFKTLVTKGLAHEWSNPKKVSLTAQGFALAERLYRDGVARGVLQEIPGIPSSGPMLFQLEAPEPGAAAAAAAAAGLPAGVLPSAALQAGRRLAAQPQQRQSALSPAAAAAAAAVARHTSAAAPAAAAARPPAKAAPATAAAAAAGGYSYAFDALPPLPGDLEDEYEDDGYGDGGDGYYAVPLSQRLQQQRRQQQQQGYSQPPAHQQQQQYEQQQRPAAVAPARAPAGGAGLGGGGGDDVIDLLSDDSPSPIRLPRRPAAGPAAATAAPSHPAPAPVAAAPASAGRPLLSRGGGEGLPAGLAAPSSVPPVPDDAVAAMVGMGYSDKKARRALRRSLGEMGLADIGRAVELAEELDSDAEASSGGEEEGGDGGGAGNVGSSKAKWPARAGSEAGAGLPAAAATRANQPSGAAAAAAAAALRRQQGWGAGQQLPPQPPPQPLARAGSGGVAAAAGVPSGRAGAVGHIRMGSSQQQPFNESQEGLSLQQVEEEQEQSGAMFDVERFFSRLDRQLAADASNGNDDGDGRRVSVSGTAAPAAAAVTAAAAAGRMARVASMEASNSGRGGGGGSGAPAANLSRSGSGGGASSGLRLRRQDVRLPPLAPGRKFEDDYEVVALVDQREQYQRNGPSHAQSRQQHMTAMQQQGLMVEERTLPIGDIVWIARQRRQPATEYVLDYVMERKSVDDLVSSIKSNRYERQKYYLKRCGLRQVYYLVEGDPDNLPDIRSTFRLYQRLTTSIQDWYCKLGPHDTSPEAGTLPTYAAWEAQCKQNGQGTTTLHDVWGMMLGAVTSLGPEAVQAILAHYPTPLHLHQAYQKTGSEAVLRGEDPHRASERMLEKLKNSRGTRTVGPDKSAKLYNFLFKRRPAGQGLLG